MSGRQRSIGGVPDYQFRRTLEAVRKENREHTTIDAAALQQDMAKRFNLSSVQPVQKTAANKTKRPMAITNYVSYATCDCCGNSNQSTEEICQHCGFYTQSVSQIQPTLAQRRGLAAMPAKVEILSPSDWSHIEYKIKDRLDSCCPICMEGFKSGNEVLLSCSHIFHKPCLLSFERFMKNGELTCPICR